MVFLVHKFAQFYTKLENHHHHHHHRHQDEDLSANLKAFRSEVSKLISQLALDLNPRLEILSLSWIEKCLGILPFINKALAKLAVDIDYPMSIWEIDSIEEYLSYTLCLLELFNSISSAFTHLEKGRVSLSHGLTLLENSASLAAKHLKEIQPGCYSTKFGEELSKESDKARIFNGKERSLIEAEIISPTSSQYFTCFYSLVRKFQKNCTGEWVCREIVKNQLFFSQTVYYPLLSSWVNFQLILYEGNKALVDCLEVKEIWLGINGIGKR